VRALARRIEGPLALDADALFAFRGDPGPLRRRRAATVLTPHPGEAARLLGCTAAEVNRDRVGAARRLAAQSGSVVVLKGAATLVATPSGPTLVNPTGGPELASGGTGDVLLGAVVGLLAQGLDARDAAALAAYVHGLAGERVAASTGPAGLLASELAHELPAAAQALRAEAAAGPLCVGSLLALDFPQP
jgi:NAD(P)H-hydrate epimerase